MWRNNYYIVGIGKIFYFVDGFVYEYWEEFSIIKEMFYSWDEFFFDVGKWEIGWNVFFVYVDGSNCNDMEK